MMRRHRLDRRQRKKQRKVIIFSMIGIVSLLSVGYASFSQNFLVSGKGTIAESAITIDQLKEKKVTEGDGLYEDVYEENRFIYRGGKPNNYISFNNELWRILSIESNNTLKIIKNENIGNKTFDSQGQRDKSSNGAGGTYCAYANYGCNAWMISSNFVSSNLTGTVNKDAELNTYLNTTYYNSLNEESKEQVITGTFDVGPVNASDVADNDTSLSNIISQEKLFTWEGKVALPTVSEYVRTSNNNTCTSAYTYYNNEECYSNGNVHNWMSNLLEKETTWITLLTPYAMENIADRMFHINGKGILIYNFTYSNRYSIDPVLYLRSDIKLSGKGTENNPYIIN